MNIQSKIKKPLNKRYLWSFFILAIITVLIVTIAMFAFYSSLQVNKTKDYSVAQLEQVCTMTDLLYNALDSVANQIIQDKDTYASMRNESINRLQEARACIKLRDIQTANSYMRYVSMYNSSNNRLMSSSYAGYLSEEDYKFYYGMLGDKRSVCVLRKIGGNYITQNDKTSTVYTFIYKINIRPHSSPDLIIVDVNEDYFSAVFRSLRTVQNEQHIILLDPDNEVISAQVAFEKSKNFTQVYSYDAFDTGLMKSHTEQSGAFTFNSETLPNRFVTFARANESGLTIVNILPYSSVVSGISQIALLTLGLALATIALGYMMSRKMSKMLYAPIQSLYDNYVNKTPLEKSGDELEELRDAFSEMYSKADRLEQGLISTFNDSRRLYLDYLLKGKIKDSAHAESAYERLGIDISSPFYTVILIECTPPQGVGEQTGTDLFISHYALENVTREVVSQFGNTDILRISENSFAVLLALSADRLPDNILAELGKILRVMQSEFSIVTTICVGKVIESYENINMCYESTKIALYADYNRQGTAFIAGGAKGPISVNQYYNKLHSKIAEYVRSDDIESCSKEFDIALSSMDNVNFQTAKIYFNHVMMTLLDEFSSFLEKNADSFGEISSKLDEMMEAANVKIMKNILIEFLTLLMHQIALNKKSGNQDTVETAKEYIEKNYANPDISLRMLADIVGLSPPYFGKIFTAVTTFTFNDYLNNIRMQKASEMLANTKMPVSQISEAVGILNTNYFYSVFKKRFGVTPSVYRQRNE